MCAGAIINARIPRVYFGASDPKAGSCGSVIDLFSLPYNHKPEVIRGVMEEECAAVLKDFFRRLRETKAAARAALQERNLADSFEKSSKPKKF